MKKIMNEDDTRLCKNKILDYGRVTAKIKDMYFEDYSFKEIRDWMEANELDRHTALEFNSTEIAILTPFGVLMQVRPTDKNQLGMWGGVLNPGEKPIDGAVRELKEETGIEIHGTDLEFIEMNNHYHKYDNGDKVYFSTYRFAVKFDYVPKVVTDEESVGAVMVTHIILKHQQEFIGRMLEKIEQ